MTAFPRLKRVSPPTVEPVSLAEAKAWLRYDDSDQDTLINSLIATATAWLDGWDGILGRCLIEQQWRFMPAALPSCGRLRLPFPDCSAVTIEAAESESGPFATVAGLTVGEPWNCGGGAEVTLDGLGNVSAALKVFRVSFKTGFGPAVTDVPASLREAIKVKVADGFRFRESAVQGASNALQVAADLKGLIQPYMVVGP